MSRNPPATKRSHTNNVLRTRSLSESKIQSKPKSEDKKSDKQETSKKLLARNNTNATLLKGRVPQPSKSGSHPLPKKKKTTTTNPGIIVPRQLKPIVADPRGYQHGKTLMNSPALAGRVVHSSSQGDLKDLLQKRLKKKSPWYDSIMAPVTGGGVKIPDAIGTNTGTFQHIENVSVAVNANGISGLKVVCPYINSFNYLAVTPTGLNLQYTVGASTAANLAFGGISGSAAFSVTPALIKANSQGHRVVSACVIAQPEVSSLGDAGEMCAFVAPFSGHQSTQGYSSYQSYWDSTILPVNSHKPLISRWYPCSSEAFPYSGASFVANGSENFSYQDFINPNDNGIGSAGAGVIPWEFGVVCSGMAPSVGTVRYQVIVNYEFIPLSSQAMVSSDPSPIDPMEEQLVNQWVSDAPVTEVISQKIASMAPTETALKDNVEPSGFGMFFNVLEELIPLASKGLAFL
jgi:hypothetical protein